MMCRLSRVLPLVVCLIVASQLPAGAANTKLECYSFDGTQIEKVDKLEWSCRFRSDSLKQRHGHTNISHCTWQILGYSGFSGRAKCARLQTDHDMFYTYCCCGTSKCNSEENMAKVVQQTIGFEFEDPFACTRSVAGVPEMDCYKGEHCYVASKEEPTANNGCKKMACGDNKNKRCSAKIWNPDAYGRSFVGPCCFSGNDPGIKCHKDSDGAMETCKPLSFCVVEQSIQSGLIIRQGCASQLPSWWAALSHQMFIEKAMCKMSPKNTAVCFCERDHCNPIKIIEDMFLPCPNADETKTSAYCVKEHERCFRFLPFDSHDVAFSECREPKNELLEDLELLDTDTKFGEGTLLQCSTKECTERKMRPLTLCYTADSALDMKSNFTRCDGLWPYCHRALIKSNPRGTVIETYRAKCGTEKDCESIGGVTELCASKEKWCCCNTDNCNLAENSLDWNIDSESTDSVPKSGSEVTGNGTKSQNGDTTENEDYTGGQASQKGRTESIAAATEKGTNENKNPNNKDDDGGNKNDGNKDDGKKEKNDQKNRRGGGASCLIGTQPVVIIVPLIWLMIKMH